MSKHQKILRLVVTALLSALTCVATMLIRIPVSGTNGYINLGDAMIFVAALLFGPLVGGVAGGVGSALGDLLGGYFHWVPFTLIVKGLEGLIAGALAHRAFRAGGRLTPRVIAGVAVSALWMVLGYFLSGSVLYSPPVAAMSVPMNLLQGAAGAALSLPLALALHRVTKDRF